MPSIKILLYLQVFSKSGETEDFVDVLILRFSVIACDEGCLNELHLSSMTGLCKQQTQDLKGQYVELLS